MDWTPPNRISSSQEPPVYANLRLAMNNPTPSPLIPNATKTDDEHVRRLKSFGFSDADIQVLNEIVGFMDISTVVVLAFDQEITVECLC